MNKTVIIGYISHHQWGAIYDGGGAGTYITESQL